jgi:outer membrane PBP1 activator LpoA protein
MEMIVSVVMGELVTRSVSFLIDRYLKPASSSKEKNRERLQWMLMRVRVAIEEAELRRIANEAMVQQLKMLKEVMYRGYYVLDTSIHQAQEEEEEENGSGHGGVSSSLSLYKFSPVQWMRVHGEDCNLLIKVGFQSAVKL